MDRAVLFVDFERSCLALKKFARYLGNFCFGGCGLGGALRALFDELPEFFRFFDVIVIHWLTSDMTINTCQVDPRRTEEFEKIGGILVAYGNPLELSRDVGQTPEAWGCSRYIAVRALA